MAHRTLNDVAAYFGAQIAAHGAVAAISAAAQTELVKRVIGEYLRHKSPADLRSMQDYIKTLGVTLQAGGVVGASLYHINAATIPNEETRAMVNAAIDHLFIKLGEDLAADLTRANVDAYVNEAIASAQRAGSIPTTSTTLTAAPGAATGGTVPDPRHPAAPGAAATAVATALTPYSSKFKLEDSAYILKPDIAQAIAGLNDIGFERWGRFIRQLRESDAGDPENEIPASQIILDALTFPFAVDAASCKVILERNVPLEEDARKDLAIYALLGLVDTYVTEVSYLARFEAAKDAWFTGKTKRTVKTAATVVGGGFILLFLAAIALTVVFFVAGTALFVVGMVLFIQKDNTYVPALLASGGGVLLLGCGPLLYVGWCVKTIEAPFTLARDTVLAMVAKFKHSVGDGNATETE